VAPPSHSSVVVGLDLGSLVESVAQRVAELMEERLTIGSDTPWMLMEEAIAYSRVPAGTFRKWVAEGRLPAHGGKRKLFHRAELDAALGYVSSRRETPTVSPIARRAS
jgi:excisionase family DNA binding protein